MTVAPSVTARPRVLLLGDGPTALSALQSLTASCQVVAILRHDAGFGDDPVRACADRHGIAIRTLDHHRDLPGMVAKLRPEAVAISSFNRVIPPETLALSRFVNVHYAPLPQYRGRANVNWAIINGERTAGISIHLVATGLDDGNILVQRQVPIGPTDTATSVYKRLNAIQRRELGKAVIRAAAGDAGLPQDHRHATYACARGPDDGAVNWSQPTAVIDRLVRALSPPFPGAFTHLGRRKLVIMRAEPTERQRAYAGRVPGRVAGRSGNEGWVDVLTGDGVLRLHEVVPEAGPAVPAASLIRSTRDTLGLSCLDLLRHIEALETRIASLERASQTCPPLMPAT